MEFHEPDQTWEALEVKNYEDYLEKYLVRARFHEKVPQEIKDSYVTIEYLMAHAYYHYPMYDEALSKLLRTMEMALKFRCKELNIDIVKGKNKKGFEIKFSFNELISKIEEVEPDKRLYSVLNWAREIRNYFMHPERHSFGGGTFKHSFLTCINTINILFAPKNYFEPFVNRLALYQDALKKYDGFPLVLEYDQKRYLIHRFSFIDIFVAKDSERQCLFIEPVLKNLSEDNIKKMTRPMPIVLYTDHIEFGEFYITGIDVESEASFKISTTDHPDNIKIYNEYLTYLEKIKKVHIFPLDDFSQSQIATTISKFRYEFYHCLFNDSLIEK